MLDDDEWEAIKDLVSVLKILKEATTFFSADSSSISTVIPAMDTIDEFFASGIIDDDTLSAPVCHALSLGKKTLNKYYKFLYITCYTPSCSSTVLHPSYKLKYFNDANWPQPWIDSAVAVTQETWERTFKPTELHSVPSTPRASEVCCHISNDWFVL
ncbi:hypothetical protein C8R42DRAFT_596926 [Lentinula raphanica]|nr:hypothetical protein C8R42DRAFT_596926 [Lentinula raphanica]